MLIEGKTLRQCSNCGTFTKNVSISFETPMCSIECDNVQYKEYEKELTRIFVREACFEDRGRLLKKPWSNLWKESNPTFGYCYIVCEAIYHYGKLENLQPYVHNFGEGIGTHWWLKDGDEVIDLTQDQFDFVVDHENIGRRATFFKGSIETPRGYISKRGHEMAKLIGLIE